MNKKTLLNQAGLILLTVITFLSAVLAVFSSLPGAYSIKRFGKSVGIAVIFISAIILSFLKGVEFGLIFSLSSGLVGIVIGFSLLNTKGIINVIGRSLFILLLCYGLIGTLFFTFETNKVGLWKKQLEKQLDVIYANFSGEAKVMGLSGKTYEGKTEIITYIENNFFSFAVILVIFFVVVNVFFLSGFFPEELKRKELFQWKVAPWFIWLPLASGFIMVFNVNTISQLAENVFRITLMPYFFQGVAIVAYYLNKKKFPNFFKVAVILSFGIFFILPSTIVGVVDHWLNFRKPRKLAGV